MDEQHFIEQVGLRVRTLRKAQGLTQEQLAEKAGLSYKYLGEIERGKINLGIANLFKIAKALKMPLKYVVDIEDRESVEEGSLREEVLGLIADKSPDELRKIVKILRVVFE